MLTLNRGRAERAVFSDELTREWIICSDIMYTIRVVNPSIWPALLLVSPTRGMSSEGITVCFAPAKRFALGFILGRCMHSGTQENSFRSAEASIGWQPLLLWPTPIGSPWLSAYHAL